MAEMIGVPAPVSRNDETDIDDRVDSEEKEGLGTLRLARLSGSSPYYSVIKYYKAAASIVKGKALVKSTASANPNLLITAATTNKGDLPSGIAAANVSNTNYFSYAYVYGYCPGAFVGTAIASDLRLGLGGTTAGYLTSEFANATLVNATSPMFFAWNHMANTDAATLNSITIKTWLG